MTEPRASTRAAGAPFSRGRIVGQWYSVLGPPLAAFGQQQLTYSLVDPACTNQLRVLLHLPMLLGLGAVGVAVALARKGWRRTDPPSRFFALLGFLMSFMATALMLAQWLPTLFLDPCRR